MQMAETTLKIFTEFIKKDEKEILIKKIKKQSRGWH